MKRTATLPSGIVLTRTTDRVYTHVWAVLDNGVVTDSGWCGSEKLAVAASDRRLAVRDQTWWPTAKTASDRVYYKANKAEIDAEIEARRGRFTREIGTVN